MILVALQAHIQRDAKSGSKTYLYAQEGESIRGRLPWAPSLCASALAKGCTLAQPKHGEFVVSVGVCVSCHCPSASCGWSIIDFADVIKLVADVGCRLRPSLLSRAASLLNNLPWERHCLTAFAKPGVGSEETPAPKRRALLLACELENHDSSSDQMTAGGASVRGRPTASGSFTYQPHRSGGISVRSTVHKPSYFQAPQSTAALS